MSIETSSNPVSASQEATIPELRTFQQLGTSIGRASETVNLFRGNVAFPLPLISLSNRGGLQADVVLNYVSDVQIEVNTRNLESPTSIMGLGWSLPYEMILLDFRGTISPYDDAYYLAASDGSQSRLYLTSQTSDLWTFEAESYDYSTVLYYPKRQIWEVTSADGMVRVYGADVAVGDDDAALRHSIKWGGADGNWTDSTIQLGQSLFPISWNLVRVQNPWGDAITFTYTRFADDAVRIGGTQGLSYTRASYLASMRDPSGRIVRFHYEDKIYNSRIREYQAAHENPQFGGPAAYQDRYETRYLDRVSVTQEVNGAVEELSTIRLYYDVENYSEPSTPGEKANLFKRYLRAISTVNASGKILPGMRFDYYTGTEAGAKIHRGALKTIMYPEGGSAHYHYSAKAIQGSALDLTLSINDAKWVAGTPRYWIGPDYVVLAKYDLLNAKLVVSVFDWNGSWLESRPVNQNLNLTLDLDTIDVVFQDDFFVLSYKLIGGGSNGTLHAWALNRVFGRYGVWDATFLEMPLLSIISADYSISAGRGFIVAAATGQSKIHRYSWDPRLKRWNADNFIVSTSALGEFVLAAANNFFLLCQYQPGMPLNLTLHYMNVATQKWHSDPTPIDSISTFIWQSDLPKLSFSLSDSFASATYLVAANPNKNTLDYAVRIYLWDKDFNVVSAPAPITGYNIPADTTEPVFISAATGSLVGNVSNLRRYDGTQWISSSFGNFADGDDLAHFAYAGDLAVGVSGVKSSIALYDPWLGQINVVLANVGVYGPVNPTISANIITVRNRIYEQLPTGELKLLDHQLPMDAQVVSNQAPLYIAYGMPNGETYIWLMKNGQLLADPKKVIGRSFAPSVTGSGMDLIGPLAFVSYIGVSFDEPNEITLHRVLDQRIGGSVPSFVVSGITVESAENEQSHAVFEYDGQGATGTVGPYGISSQYSLVKAVVGSENIAIAPFGYSIYRFYDGLMPKGVAPDFLYSFANGLMRDVVAYDSLGNIVAHTMRTWEIVRQTIDAASGAPTTLVGAYARLASSTETIFDVNPISTPQPALPVTTRYSYNEANGQPCFTEMVNNDSASGAPQVVRESYKYAYEYYPALAAPRRNLITAIAAKTRSVDGAIVRYEATTWSQFSANGQIASPASLDDPWAPLRQFLARNANATLRASDWNNTTEPSSADWKRLSQVIQRDRRGELSEYLNDKAVPVSVFDDQAQRFVVARVENASRVSQQCTYVGFEAYEDLSPWTLAGSEQNLRTAITDGDSFTGTRSLLMGGNTVPNTSPLACTLATLDKLGRQYVLACWVKTEAGFLSGVGTAAIEISVGANTVTQEIPATDNIWTPVALLVDVSGNLTPQAIELRLINTRGKSMRVDNLSFTPVVSAFSATVYDPKLLLPNAVVRGTSAATRSLRGDFDEVQISVDSLDAVVEIRSSYLARRSILAGLANAKPNSVLRLVPRGWGFYQSFNLGDVYAGSWRSNTPNAWRSARNALQHLPGQSDPIDFEGFPTLDAGTVNNFGASVRVTPAGPITAAIGLRFGLDLQLSWQPLTGRWTLYRAETPLFSAPACSLLDLDYAQFSGLLDQSILPPEFLPMFGNAGLPLAATSSVRFINSSAWQVKDAVSQVIYYLARSAIEHSQIQVISFPREWTLVIVDRTIVFYADGGTVLSYELNQSPDRSFGLFASDDVAYDNAVFYTDPGISISYLDGLARLQQEQVFTSPNFIGKATIYDALSRNAIETQGALLAPVNGAWGAFQPNLALLDWQSMLMTGLVADQNPESGGYPYSRTRYENSPLARKVETGAPGAAYAIRALASDSHTARIYYGLNDESFGLPAGKFATTISVSPDNVRRVQLCDQRGASVAVAVSATRAPEPVTWSLMRLRYDAAGNLIQSTTPMGWSDTYGWDFLGQMLSSTRANEGQTRSMYDSIGRLRFQMDARGALTPNYIRYWKYDAVSRVVEEGASLQSWPGELSANVDDQSFPLATPSNRYDYDFVVPPTSPPDLLARGMLTRAISSNEIPVPVLPGTPPPDDFVASETFAYDVYAEVVSHTLKIAADGVEQVTEYGYNNQGEVLSVRYPSTGSLVFYRRDLPGRVIAVGSDSNLAVSYSYNNNGGLDSETMFADNGQQVGGIRRFSYSPTGWLARNSGTEFEETLTYAANTAGSASLYGGTPSRVITGARGGRGPIDVKYALDATGRLANADYGNVASAFSYDANGNIEQIGTATNSYSAETKDRLQSQLVNGVSQSFQYDATGDLAASSKPSTPQSNLAITWDCFRALALDSQIGAPISVTQSVRYNYLGRRLSKALTPAAGTPSVKHYLRGAGADSLVERTIGGDTTEFIHGPRGLLQVRVNGTAYFIVTDQLGSIRAVLDANANLVAGFDYLPYGAENGAPLGSNPDVQSYRFTERELDETGLYDFRARCYDANVGRFVSADPAHEFFSPYSYANNNPLIYLDPTGEFLETIIAAIVAAVTAAAAAIAAAATEIAVVTAAGAAIGFVSGVVQGSLAVSALNLSGGEAAGVFFGTLVLSTVGGALSGGAAAVTGTLVEAATVGGAVALLATGIAVQGGISAAQSAGQAALVGDDPGKAAWQNAIAGSVAFGVGVATGGVAKTLLATNTWKGTVNAMITGAISGTTGGIAGAGTDALLNESSERDTLTSMLQGIAFGLVGGVVPEVIGYKFSKFRTAKLADAVRVDNVLNQQSRGLYVDDGGL